MFPNGTIFAIIFFKCQTLLIINVFVFYSRIFRILCPSKTQKRNSAVLQKNRLKKTKECQDVKDELIDHLRWEID